MLKNIMRKYVTNIEPIVPPLLSSALPEVDIYRYRKWTYIKPYKETISYDFKRSSFSVSSYNILSQHYLWPTVYSYISPQYLNLDYRLGLLNQIYKQLNCDIMCFQEMEYDLYKKIWNDKSKYGVFHNYDSIFVKKPKPSYWGDKPDDKMDGCSIFVKSSQFKIIAQDSFEIRDRNFLPINDVIQERLLSRNTVAVIVLLEHQPTKKKIFLTNTHLYWNPNFDDVKYLQTLILTRELRKFIKEHDNGSNTLIMCGDFNSNSRSMVYNYLCKKDVDLYDKKIDEIATDYHLTDKNLIRDNFQTMESSYPQDKYTVYTPHYKDAIDYIWFNPESEIELVRILDGISTEYLSNEIGFPNDKYPSDHIPIVSQFHFK